MDGQSEELELDGPEIKDPFFRISICFSRPRKYRVGMFMKSAEMARQEQSKKILMLLAPLQEEAPKKGTWRFWK